MSKNFDITLPEEPIEPAPPVIPLWRKAARKAKNAVFSKRVSSEEPSVVHEPWPVMPYPTVNLSYWRPIDGVNFGDELSRTIVELMLCRKGFTIFDHVEDRPKLLAVGSVLHEASDGAIVWGSGLNGSVPLKYHNYSRIDVRAVRGPLTRTFLQNGGFSVPEIYGDPASLLKSLTGDRFSLTSEYEIGLVPNLFDMRYIEANDILQDHPAIHLIDPMRSWDVVVADILRCRYIIASSLHGLVIADTFGIPARYIRFSEKESLLKYEDYYEGTGRALQTCRTLDKALTMGPPAIYHWDKDALFRAFPYDIWK